ncbi:hypothetical protein PIB30_070051 [Stylosanthes scabra]|uniref:Putative plant transposon protein domain-containing protein n=1 Tax=Stylosanthes scabra TaxID=79078 RepID=A0ABU6XPN2_9FABA|nr:hypothetical protein [Stylosanthes scabra]
MIHSPPWQSKSKQGSGKKLTRPTLNVGYSLVRELYANAWRTDAEKKSPPPYTTQVRGAKISFAPDDIRRVFKLRETPLPNAPSYHDRKANNDLRLEEVLAYLCEDGAQWVLHRDGRPHFLRRTDLQPMARGWYEFVCRSIIPTTNRSEVTVERAVLIHSIIIGEDIRTNLRSKLPFPGLISLLCQEKKVSIPRDTLIPRESGINGELMGRVRETREPREPRRQQQPRQEGQPQQQHF